MKLTNTSRQNFASVAHRQNRSRAVVAVVVQVFPAAPVVPVAPGLVAPVDQRQVAPAVWARVLCHTRRPVPVAPVVR